MDHVERRELTDPRAVLGSKKPKIGGQEHEKAQSRGQPQPNRARLADKQPEQRRNGHKNRQIIGKTGRPEHQAPRQGRHAIAPPIGAQQQRHAAQAEQLRQRKAAGNRAGIDETVAAEGEQHGQSGPDAGAAGNLSNGNQR